MLNVLKKVKFLGQTIAMSEHSNIQNTEEVVESIKKMIKSTRDAGCEEDEGVSNSELKKDKNISVQTSFMPKQRSSNNYTQMLDLAWNKWFKK